MTLICLNVYEILSFESETAFKQKVIGLDRTIVESDNTNINLALNHTLTQMFNVRNGMRPNVNKTLVFMTDGWGGADDDDYPKRRKDFFDANIKVIAIGIGDDINSKGLIELSPNNHHFAETIEDLLNETFRASIHVCHGT